MNAAASRSRTGENEERPQAGGRVVEIDAAIRAALAAAREPRTEDAPERDWSATLQLVHRASDVLRAAQERVRDLENRNRELGERADQQAEMLQARILQAQVRAEEAEQRRNEAEEWLRRIHAAVAEHFQP